jgi:hypothetical protein
VELFYKGQWVAASVSPSSPGDATNVGKVACNELALKFDRLVGLANHKTSSIKKAPSVYLLGEDVDAIEIKCTGSEAKLSDCEMNWYAQNHDTDVVVMCVEDDNFESPKHTIRLEGGPTPNEGRVQIFEENKWWTLSSEGWKGNADVAQKNADVACKQLGFGSGSYLGATGEDTDAIGSHTSYLNVLSPSVIFPPVSFGDDTFDMGSPNPNSQVTKGWYDVLAVGQCKDFCRWVNCDQNGICEFLCSLHDGNSRALNGNSLLSLQPCTFYGEVPPHVDSNSPEFEDAIVSDTDAGWYDVIDQGVCNDYCRWTNCSMVKVVI